MRKPKGSDHAPATTDRIARAIGLLRGQKVLLDFDLAVLYGVETKALKRAVKRNLTRFPDDFLFELTEEEFEDLRCQSGASRWGGRRYRPYAKMVFDAIRELMAPDKRPGRPIGFGPWKPKP